MVAEGSVSLLFCIPFVGMLLSIAVFPLINSRLWEKCRKYAVLLWSLAFLIPFAICFGFGEMSQRLLEVLVNDYFTFIILLFGLFCVSGNISFQGGFRGTPRSNVIMLLAGTFLASWIGTTGASMVMIRPVIQANKWRGRKTQVFVFFIFLVSNLGGCLTPVGDPPLLMGFIRGVPFFWSLRLLPVMLLNTGILLVIFFLLDHHAYKKDMAEGIVYASSESEAHFKISGAHNIIFLGAIVFAVVLSGVLTHTELFSGGLPIYRDVELGYGALIEVVIILLAAFLSFRTTDRKIRMNSHFSWGAIQEVAVLFIGIFITMIPALMLLETNGARLGVREPWQMFWVTGAMSSFLDNTPTYLVFLTTAGTLGAPAGIDTAAGMVSGVMLKAISCGAVFMGANTYIGNAPNFMVKSIAEENGVRMPSFFGYMFWSLRFLIPVFILDTILFFL